MGYAIAYEALGVRNSGTTCLAISGTDIVFTVKYTRLRRTVMAIYAERPTNMYGRGARVGGWVRTVICDTYNSAPAVKGIGCYGVARLQVVRAVALPPPQTSRTITPGMALCPVLVGLVQL